MLSSPREVLAASGMGPSYKALAQLTAAVGSGLGPLEESKCSVAMVAWALHVCTPGREAEAQEQSAYQPRMDGNLQA